MSRWIPKIRRLTLFLTDGYAGEITVGTAINVEHRAASGVGSHILAEAVLESFDGRFYTLRVTARDDVQEIGRGTVNRAAVSVSKFLHKMKAK
jgi:fluoroacetyl-CoA thioesterase